MGIRGHFRDRMKAEREGWLDETHGHRVHLDAGSEFRQIDSMPPGHTGPSRIANVAAGLAIARLGRADLELVPSHRWFVGLA